MGLSARRALTCLATFAVAACAAFGEPEPAPADAAPAQVDQPEGGLVYRGTVKRNLAARRAYHRANPCPSTGSTRGACPGYVVDHIVPLCAGGADDPRNMQWQAKEESHRKDAIERRTCAALREVD